MVQSDRDQAQTIVDQFNDQFRKESWELSPVGKIAGRPRYEYRNVRDGGKRLVARAKTVADALDAGSMQKEIERLENAGESYPALAIGTAKGLVESCCKTILTRRKFEFSKSADLRDLGKLVTKELKLVPDGIFDAAKGAENIRLILCNQISIPHNLLQVRCLYGSGHGRDEAHSGLDTRRARLAVASAAAFIDFVSKTYRERELQDAKAGAPADLNSRGRNGYIAKHQL